MIACEINYQNFDWKSYLNLNHLPYLNKEDTWKHWTLYGDKEGRPFSLKNNSRVHHARFGNLFFINLAIHFICLKSKLKFDYKYYDQFKNLGLDLFIGNETFTEDINITDENFFELVISDNKVFKNIIIKNDAWCQTRDFCIFLKEYFSLKKIKRPIIKKNQFKSRYNNNNDLFIHVRLGDIENSWNSSFEYYDKIIQSLVFKKGYISSDSIKSEICAKLIHKYNLNIIDKNEVETIMFASTCDNIILSGGTFSWLIGFLAFFSKKIYFPKDKINKWYGDIFVFSEWTGIPE